MICVIAHGVVPDGQLTPQTLPSRRDARLVTELVAGVTRWRRRLDYLIQHLTKSSNLDALDPPMRQILRCARGGAGRRSLLSGNLPARRRTSLAGPRGCWRKDCREFLLAAGIPQPLATLASSARACALPCDPCCLRSKLTRTPAVAMLRHSGCAGGVSL